MAQEKSNHTSKSFGRRLIVPIIFSVIGLGGGYWIWGGGNPSQPMSSQSAEEHVHAEQEEVAWTCSMHPQIRQPKPGACPICGMDLIPISSDASGDMAGLRRFTTSPAGLELMNLQMTPVVRQFVEAEVQMVGKIAYDETKLANIAAWVPGRIDRLYVDYTGITVNEGDHMVYLYSPEILTTYEELKRAAASVRNLSSGSSDVIRGTMQSTLEASREKLRRWGLTQAQIREAEEKGITSDHITIYSPATGTVIHRSGQEGMYVQTGTPIYTIADMSEMWVMLDAYESDLLWLKYGQQVEFATEAYPGEVFTGKISFIDPYLNSVTRTVKVRVDVPNENRRLKPEMFVHATARSQVALGGKVMDPEMVGKWVSPMHPEIVKDSAGKCDICGMDLVPAAELGYVSAGSVESAKPLVIPVSAALVTGKRAIVYVSVPGQEMTTFEGREIVLGPRAGDYYIVRAGLEENELVVTNGNFKIDSALQILAKPSMMTPEGGGGGGHDHGGGSKPVGSADAAPNVELDFKTRAQLEAILAIHERLHTLEAGSSESTSTLESMKAAIDAVDMTLLSGHAHMVWMEYMRRLLNDVAEVRYAVGPREVSDATTTMARNLEALGKQLGLGSHAGHTQRQALIVVDAATQETLNAVVNNYLGMQEALAADSFEDAAATLISFRDSASAIDKAKLPPEVEEIWSSLTESIGKLTAATDIGSLRDAFGPVSDAILELVGQVDLSRDSPLYSAHCPMAFDGDGGDWLQRTDEVFNPYYGNMMLNCGTVTNRFEAMSDAATPVDSAPAHEGHQHD